MHAISYQQREYQISAAPLQQIKIKLRWLSKRGWSAFYYSLVIPHPAECAELWEAGGRLLRPQALVDLQRTEHHIRQVSRRLEQNGKSASQGGAYIKPLNYLKLFLFSFVLSLFHYVSPPHYYATAWNLSYLPWLDARSASAEGADFAGGAFATSGAGTPLSPSRLVWKFSSIVSRLNYLQLKILLFVNLNSGDFSFACIINLGFDALFKGALGKPGLAGPEQ